MAWKRIVQIITAVSGCPKCGNSGFDLEPGADLYDKHVLAALSLRHESTTPEKFVCRRW